MLTPPPGSFTVYFFLFGRCVSAEAAAVLACGLDFELRSTLLAAEAALRLVTSLLGFLGMVRIHLLSCLYRSQPVPNVARISVDATGWLCRTIKW